MAEQDEDDPLEQAQVGSSGRAYGASGWNTWVRRSFSPVRFRSADSSRNRVVAASDEPGLSPSARAAATKAAVNNLDRRERSIGFIALAFELFLTASVVVPVLTHHVKLTKADLKTLGNGAHIFLLEALVVAMFLLLGTLMRRRALLGFACLATGIFLVELPALRVFGLAYLGLGMWLLLRGLKAQQRVQGGTRPSAGRATSQPRSSRRSRAAAKDVASRSAPKPSKRYTPPKPTRRPPPKKPAAARAEPPK